MSSAERNVRAMEIGAGTPKDSKTIMAEINEDFDRIRAINEDVKTATSSNASLSYKSISDRAVELKKRATRLKADLTGLPKATAEEKHQKPSVPPDEAQMRSLLSSLNGVMTSFLSNPVFSDMGTLDNQLALKARRDLEDMIELSEVVKKALRSWASGPANNARLRLRSRILILFDETVAHSAVLYSNVLLSSLKVRSILSPHPQEMFLNSLDPRQLVLEFSHEELP